MPQASNNRVTDGARYFISDSKRTLELKHILTHSVSDGNSAEVVVNARGEVIGKSRTGGGFTITLKVRSSQRRREVAWKRMQQTGVEFRFDIQPSATQRDQFHACEVATVADNGGNGDYSLDVTIIATSRKTIDL